MIFVVIWMIFTGAFVVQKNPMIDPTRCHGCHGSCPGFLGALAVTARQGRKKSGGGPETMIKQTYVSCPSVKLIYSSRKSMVGR